jgi:signal transduction histidine kinase
MDSKAKNVLRILIIEDNAIDRETYVRHLKQSAEIRFEVTEVDNAEDGLAICAAEVVDCVLLDYKLPDLDGLEFLGELAKRSPELKPVVMLTSIEDEKVAVQALKNGAHDYLKKGQFAADDLLLSVREAINKVELINNLRKRTEDLERSNKDLERFAHTVSHELKAPMRTITGFADLIRRKDTQLDTELERYLDFISNATQRMESLVIKTLEYARANQKALTRELTDLDKILLDIREDLKAHIAESGATIISTKLPTLKVDPVAIMQVFRNLLQNAIKYCDVKPQITIDVSEKQGEYCISVRDNGIGFESRFREQVFEPYSRLVPRSQQGDDGSGLGLAICKRIVEDHNGSMWVESEPGKGSTFYLMLPKD